MSELKKTVAITNKYKTFCDEVLEKNNILGFNKLDHQYQYLCAVALGLDNPTSREQIKGASGWFRTDVLNTEYIKCIYLLILLGKATSDEVDERLDLQKNLDQSELCADAGFLELEKTCSLMHNDNESICKYYLKNLDKLYDKIKESQDK